MNNLFYGEAKWLSRSRNLEELRFLCVGPTIFLRCLVYFLTTYSIVLLYSIFEYNHNFK
jgi:hypothetical protein